MILQTDPLVKPCPLCGCPIQRTPHGTVRDGMRAHYQAVHRNEREKP